MTNSQRGGQVSGSAALVWLLFLASFISIGSILAHEEARNLPAAELLLVDGQGELDDADLEPIFANFGRQISEVMLEEVDKLIDSVAEDKEQQGDAAQVDSAQLGKLKDANEILTRDTQTRIEMAGKPNSGEMQRSTIGELGQSFFGQVSNKLQSASAYISHQMSSLGGFAPKIKGKIKAIPGKLRKLIKWPSFLSFKVRFNKTYKSLRDELFRHMIYLRTQTLVGVSNLKLLFGKIGHLLGATQFADWTHKEYLDTYNNPQLETESNTPAGSVAELDAKTRGELLKLAREKKNVFGQDMSEALIKGAKTKSRRRKRAVDLNGEAEEEEEEEYDEMEDADENFLTLATGGSDSLPGLVSDSEEFEDANSEFGDEEEEDEEKVVEKWAGQFEDSLDLSRYEHLDEIVDEALAGLEEFEPIDLRLTGCIHTPENQEGCGACYAYVVTTAAQYYNCMMSPERKLERYHARFLSDCGRYATPEGSTQRSGCNGCRGGNISSAIGFTRFAGAMKFMFYNMARSTLPDEDFHTKDYCVYPRPESLEEWGQIKVPFLANRRFGQLKSSEIDLHLRTVGPVYVNVKLWDSFESYKSGVFRELEHFDPRVHHAMLIVGHDRDSRGRHHWIVQNSHGTPWGERGYLRISHEAFDYYKAFAGGILPQD